MRNRRRSGPDDLRFNPKRSLRRWQDEPADQRVRNDLSARVGYTGSPHHKRDPGDFNLTPPAAPRQNATLCDAAGLRSRAEAEALLRRGIEAGLISERVSGGFPTQVWAIRDDGVVFEAELENASQGQYHGYPMPLADPFRLIVLERAKRA